MGRGMLTAPPEVEFVTFRVSHERPGVPVLLSVSDAGGTEPDEALDLGFRVRRDDIQVEAVLTVFDSGTRANSHVGSASRSTGPIRRVTASMKSDAGELARRLRIERAPDRRSPKAADHQSVEAVEYHAGGLDTIELLHIIHKPATRVDLATPDASVDAGEQAVATSRPVTNL